MQEPIYFITARLKAYAPGPLPGGGGTQFFFKLPILNVFNIGPFRFIPMMNGLPIICTHKEWIASQLHHPHNLYTLSLHNMLTKYHHLSLNGKYYFLFI